MHVQECIKNLPIYQVDQKNGLFLILTNYKVKYKRVLANIGVIVPLRKKLAERIDKAKANKSRIRLYDYLLSIDTESQGKADSIKLSDLTQFLAVSPNNPDFAEDASIVAANFKDLDKFNPNKLAELLRSFSELYYKEVQDVPANELYKSAIHALLFKTIDKAIQEDQQSGKSLNETIARLNEIIDKVEPKGIDKEKSLLKGFSDYVAPSNKRIQDIMSSFLYPRSDEKKQETKEEKETRLAAEKKADKERQKIQDKLTRYNTEKEEKRNNRNEKERIEKEKQKQHYASVEQSKQKKALSQGKHKQASLLDQERIKQFSSAKQKEHDIKSALEKEKNPPKLEALKLQLTQATLEVSQAKGILPTFYVDYINAKEEERKALLELEKAREDTRKAEQEYDSIKRRVERNKDELNRLGEHKAPQEVGGLLSKFSEYEVVLELRKLCNGRLKIGKGDIDAQKDRLKSRKIALVHQLEILNRREDDPDRIKAIEKIQNENNLQGTQQNDQKLKDYISDTKLKLELNLAMVRSHLHMLSVDDGSLLEHKLSEDVGEILRRQNRDSKPDHRTVQEIAKLVAEKIRNHDEGEDAEQPLDVDAIVGSLTKTVTDAIKKQRNCKELFGDNAYDKKKIEEVINELNGLESLPLEIKGLIQQLKTPADPTKSAEIQGLIEQIFKKLKEFNKPLKEAKQKSDNYEKAIKVLSSLSMAEIGKKEFEKNLKELNKLVKSLPDLAELIATLSASSADPKQIKKLILAKIKELEALNSPQLQEQKQQCEKIEKTIDLLSDLRTVKQIVTDIVNDAQKFSKKIKEVEEDIDEKTRKSALQGSGKAEVASAKVKNPEIAALEEALHQEKATLQALQGQLDTEKASSGQKVVQLQTGGPASVEQITLTDLDKRISSHNQRNSIDRWMAETYQKFLSDYQAAIPERITDIIRRKSWKQTERSSVCRGLIDNMRILCEEAKEKLAANSFDTFNGKQYIEDYFLLLQSLINRIPDQNTEIPTYLTSVRATCEENSRRLNGNIRYMEGLIKEEEKCYAAGNLENQAKQSQLSSEIKAQGEKVAAADSKLQERTKFLAANLAATQAEEKRQGEATKREAEIRREVANIEKSMPKEVLSDEDFKEYYIIMKNAIEENAKKKPPSPQILIESKFRQLERGEWYQAYDVLIDVRTNQCILAFQGVRGTATESLAIAKGNFGDVVLGFNLFTNQCDAIKKELDIFIAGGTALDKRGMNAVCSDVQDDRERKQESKVTQEAGLSSFQVQQEIGTRETAFNNMLRHVVHSRKYLEASLKGVMIDVAEKVEAETKGQKKVTFTDDQKEKLWKKEKSKHIWTVQKLLASRKGEFKGDFKEEVLDLNEKFIRETSVDTASAPKEAVDQATLPGNSELYQKWQELDSKDSTIDEHKLSTLRSDVKKRFELAIGFLRGLDELHNGVDGEIAATIHGDIKPKNFKGGKFFDFGTSWLVEQIEEVKTLEEELRKKGKPLPKEKREIGKLDFSKVGTTEFMPPEYMFESCTAEKEVPGGRSEQQKSKPRKSTVVEVTKAGDIYSAGVSLFGYTDLDTYKEAFRLHSPDPDKPPGPKNPGKAFPYTEPYDEQLTIKVNGRIYIRLYDYKEAEASGLELLNALKVLNKQDPNKFGDLYDRLFKLFEKMCHFDPNKRSKSINKALLELNNINNLYQELLKGKTQEKGLAEALKQVQDDKITRASIDKIKKLAENSSINGPDRKPLSLIAAVVSQYYDYQANEISKAFEKIQPGHCCDVLGLTKATEKPAINSALLLAVKDNKPKIFEALFEKLSPKDVINFLTTTSYHNKNRDIVYIAARNNNNEILEIVFKKLDAGATDEASKLEVAKLKEKLILGCSENKSGFMPETGDNLLAWASYHKNETMLKFLAEELKKSFEEQKLPKEQISEKLQLNGADVGATPKSESIFHAVAQNNDVKQFILLCNVFYNNTANPHKEFETLQDIPVDVLIQFGDDKWKGKVSNDLTPFALFFSKNSDFVEVVFDKLNRANTSDREKLLSLLSNNNNNDKLSPIQMAFDDDNNSIMQAIFKYAAITNQEKPLTEADLSELFGKLIEAKKAGTTIDKDTKITFGEEEKSLEEHIKQLGITDEQQQVLLGKATTLTGAEIAATVAAEIKDQVITPPTPKEKPLTEADLSELFGKLIEAKKAGAASLDGATKITFKEEEKSLEEHIKQLGITEIQQQVLLEKAKTLQGTEEAATVVAEIKEQVITPSTVRSEIFNLQNIDGDNVIHDLVRNGNYAIIEEIIGDLNNPQSGVVDRELKKAAFFKALVQQNNKGLTPLSFLMVRPGFVEKDEKIFSLLVDAITEPESKALIGVEEINSKFLNVQQSGKKVQAFLSTAIYNKKYGIAGHIIDFISTLDEVAAFNELAAELQRSPSVVGLDIERNVFHYLFEKGKGPNKEAKTSVFDKISRQLVKGLGLIEGEKNPELRESYEKIISAFGKKDKNDRTPLTLAIESGNYTSIVDFLTNSDISGNFSNTITDILLFPCERESSFIKYLISEPNLNKRNGYIDGILNPIFNSLNLDDQSRVVKEIQRILDSIPETTKKQENYTETIEKLKLITTSYTQDQQDLVQITEISSKLTTFNDEMGRAKSTIERLDPFKPEHEASIEEISKLIVGVNKYLSALEVSINSNEVIKKGIKDNIEGCKKILEETKELLLTKVKDNLTKYDKKALKIVSDVDSNGDKYINFTHWFDAQQLENLQSTGAKVSGDAKKVESDQSWSTGWVEQLSAKGKLFTDIQRLHSDFDALDKKHKYVTSVADDPSNKLQVSVRNLINGIGTFETASKEEIFEVYTSIKDYIKEYGEEACKKTVGEELWATYVEIAGFFDLKFIVTELSQINLTTVQQQDMDKVSFDINTLLSKIDSAKQALADKGQLIKLKNINSAIRDGIANKNDEEIKKSIERKNALLKDFSSKLSGLDSTNEPKLKSLLAEVSTVVKNIYNDILQSKVLDKSRLFEFPEYKDCITSLRSLYEEIRTKYVSNSNLDQILKEHIESYEKHFFDSLTHGKGEAGVKKGEAEVQVLVDLADGTKAKKNPDGTVDLPKDSKVTVTKNAQGEDIVTLQDGATLVVAKYIDMSRSQNQQITQHMVSAGLDFSKFTPANVESISSYKKGEINKYYSLSDEKLKSTQAEEKEANTTRKTELNTRLEELKKLQVKVEQEFSKTGLKLPTGGKEKLVKEVTEGAARLVGALDQGLQAREALYTEQNRKLAEKKGEAVQKAEKLISTEGGEGLYGVERDKTMVLFSAGGARGGGATPAVAMSMDSSTPTAVPSIATSISTTTPTAGSGVLSGGPKEKIVDAKPLEPVPNKEEKATLIQKVFRGFWARKKQEESALDKREEETSFGRSSSIGGSGSSLEDAGGDPAIRDGGVSTTGGRQRVVTKEEHKAATVIQSVWRGARTRREIFEAGVKENVEGLDRYFGEILSKFSSGVLLSIDDIQGVLKDYNSVNEKMIKLGQDKTFIRPESPLQTSIDSVTKKLEQIEAEIIKKIMSIIDDPSNVPNIKNTLQIIEILKKSIEIYNQLLAGTQGRDPNNKEINKEMELLKNSINEKAKVMLEKEYSSLQRDLKTEKGEAKSARKEVVFIREEMSKIERDMPKDLSEKVRREIEAENKTSSKVELAAGKKPVKSKEIIALIAILPNAPESIKRLSKDYSSQFKDFSTEKGDANAARKDFVLFCRQRELMTQKLMTQKKEHQGSGVRL